MAEPDQDERTTPATEVAARFEEHRRRLTGLAYRMLGTFADAEDVVQEAWLRLDRAGADDVVDLGGWLTRVTARLCLDRLRSLRSAREDYVGPWLPEPVVRAAGPAVVAPGDPADVVVADDSVRLALLVVLEGLTPEQRVALVLHDVFAVPFEEVADVLATTPANARQLASRARRAVAEQGPPPRVAPEVEAAVVDGFRRAVLGGDLAALVSALAPDVVLRSDGGGRVRAALRPVAGADAVARLLLGLAGRAAEGRLEVLPAVANGEPGFVLRLVTTSEVDVSVVVLRVTERGVEGVDLVRNPDKLTRVPLPIAGEGGLA